MISISLIDLHPSTTTLQTALEKMSRLGHSEALLGPELSKKVRETPILVVGAGGIGCELREWTDRLGIWKEPTSRGAVRRLVIRP